MKNLRWICLSAVAVAALVGAARGSDTVPVGRAAYAYVLGTTQQTATGTTEQVLGTFNLPAGGLDAVGRGLVIEAAFATAANTNSKTAKCYFGATSVQAVTIVSGAAMYCRIIVEKTGSNTQNVFRWAMQNNAVVNMAYTAATETDSAAITIKATCTDAVSSAGDCKLVAFSIEYHD